MSGKKLDWKGLLSALRYNDKLDELDSSRSPFAKDIDRIIFSDSFRRLAKKSQVHPLAMNDHLHNRLSHSLEVSCVGRTLGTKVGYFLKERNELPEKLSPEHVGEIVQAACLAHDIGNPPFGHAGEEAIREWFRAPNNGKYLAELTSNQKSDFTCFDGNAQGFRVVSQLEMAGPKDGGMKLTYPVLATMVKYPISSYRADAEPLANGRKYNYQCIDKIFFKHVFEMLGLSINDKKQLRHPLSFLSEAADDICYSIIDLEDAIELRLIDENEFYKIYQDISNAKKIIENINIPKRRKISHIRALAIGHLVGICTKEFENKYDSIMRGEENKALVSSSEDAKSLVKKAKDLASKKIYSEKRKTAIEIGSYNIYQILLSTFIPAVYSQYKKEETSYKYKKAYEILSIYGYKTDDEDLYQGYINVIDYITGMTDSYATFVAQQFLGSGHGPWQS